MTFLPGMSNVLKEEKRQQVLALGRLGWSLRRIEEATGVRRETVSGYLKAAGLVVRGRGRPPARSANPAISPEVSTDSSSATTAGKGTDDTAPVPAQRPRRAPQASACEPYRELIVNALGRGRNAMAIWQDLVDDHGFPAGYASVRRFVSTVRQQPAVEARAVITTDVGEEAQVDYGDGPMVRDPDTGKYRRTRLFVLTLGYSRKAVRLLVFRSSAQVWAELHERAFRRLGGTTRVVVLDNLKEGVLAPDIYDPTLNPLYRDVLAHYGVVALPCRVRDPDRKGKVESSVGHTQMALRGLRFEHLDDGQAYLDRWDRRWADTRIHGTTKRQVAAMFEEERPALGPLPLEAVPLLPVRPPYPCIWTVASRSPRPTTRRRPAGSDAASTCSGTTSTSASSTRAPASCCASTCAPSAAGIASPTTTGPRAPRRRLSPCSPPPSAPGPPSPPSATTSTGMRAPPASDASSASSPLVKEARARRR